MDRSKIFVSLVCMWCLYLCIGHIIVENTKQKAINVGIENNATVYLDGNEVDIESVNLYKYAVVYDAENNVLKLTTVK